MAMQEKFESMVVVRRHFGMKEVRLTYLDFEGLGEPIRVALKLAGVDFEDRRLSFDEFKTIKHTFPSGVVPVLQDGESVMPQFKAIMRYLGRKYDLAPKNVEENFLVDEVLETVEDMNGTYINTIYMGMKPQVFGMQNATEEYKKTVIKKMRGKICAEPLPKFLERVNEVVEKQGILNGNKVTIADIYVYCSLRRLRAGYLDHIPQDIYIKHENLVHLMRKMEEMPEIKTHYGL